MNQPGGFLRGVLYGLLTWVGCGPLVGCGDPGPKTYPVSGSVTLDGQPLAEGDIYFFPLDPNVSADAGKITGGQFALRAKAGTMRVEIRATRVVPGRRTPMGGPVREESLPSRYNKGTELRAEVAAGGYNQFHFALRSD
jgi:hypothetical protein